MSKYTRKPKTTAAETKKAILAKRKKEIDAFQ